MKCSENSDLNGFIQCSRIWKMFLLFLTFYASDHGLVWFEGFEAKMVESIQRDV